MKRLLYAICFLSFHNCLTQANLQTDSAKKDLLHLQLKFESIHYNPYFTTTKEDFESIQSQLTKNWTEDSISYREFIRIGMKLSALMSGGHSSMDWKNPRLIPALKAHKYLPFSATLNEFKGTINITKSFENALPIGATILTINNISMLDLYHECMTYIGGISAFKNASCEKILPLYLFFNSRLSAPYEIKTTDHGTYRVEGIELNELAGFLNKAEYREDYTFEILEENIGLLSYNRCNQYKKFKRFLKNTFETIEANNVKFLIIDIRENGGGNSSLNDLLLNYLTQKPYRQSSGRYWKVSKEAKQAYAENPIYQKIFGKEFMVKYMNSKNQSVISDFDSSLTMPQKMEPFFHGKSCFLMGPNTFSSANFLADAIKTYQLSTLIGKASGEYTNDFGEQISFILPHSKSQVFISSTYDIGANGNAEILSPVFPDIEVQENELDFAIKWLKQTNK